MPDLKIQHIITLAELLSKGARNNFVQITTSSLGRSINNSQQAASKHILELENGGFIDRVMTDDNFLLKLPRRGTLNSLNFIQFWVVV